MKTIFTKFIALVLLAVLLLTVGGWQQAIFFGQNVSQTVPVNAIGPVDFFADMALTRSVIARDGACSAATTSCTLDATAQGDLLIAFAYRNASTTAPSLPAGWTSISTQSTAATGTVGSLRIGCRVATGVTDGGSGTWTNATDVNVVSYTNTGVGTSANCNTTGIGGTAFNNAKTSTTADFPALTMTDTSGASWVAGFLGNSAGGLCAPTGMTLVQNTGVGSGPAVRANDTNAGVTAWADATCTVTSSTWMTAVVEILATNTSNGTSLTQQLLTAGTRGMINTANYSAITGTAPTLAAHQSSCVLGGTVTVGGLTFTSSHTSKALSFDNTTTLNHIDVSAPTGEFSRASVLVCLTPTFTTFAGSNVMDLVYIIGSNGHKGIIQLSSTNCAGTAGYDLEETVGNTITPCVSPTSGIADWALIDTDFSAGSLHMSFYDSTFAQLGTTQTKTGIAFTAGETVSSFGIGNQQSGTTTGANIFENWMAVFSGNAPFPLGPQNTTQAPVYLISKTANQMQLSASSTTTLSPPTNLPSGVTNYVWNSYENAAGTTSGCTDTAGNTYTQVTTVNLATQGHGEMWLAKNTTGNAANIVTCTHTASTFRNIIAVAVGGASLTAPTDTSATGTTSAGSADVTTGSFTPSTSVGSVLVCGYITAGVALTPGTNYFGVFGSSTTSASCALRTSAPNSSQTATLKQANTSSKWAIAVAIKQ
jgi:hypothetical protein